MLRKNIEGFLGRETTAYPFGITEEVLRFSARLPTV